MRRIFYTAGLVIPDGSDTSADGDGCEPGHGYTSADGWMSPDSSLIRVFEDPHDVEPDTFEPDEFNAVEDYFPVHWLVTQLTSIDRLYEVEIDDVVRAGHGTTFYSGYDRKERDQHNPHGDVGVRMAAHVEGFTEAEMTTAIELLRRPHLDSRYRVSVEFTGAHQIRPGLLPGQMWVARCASERIGSAPTEVEAHRLAVAHYKQAHHLP